MTDSPKPDNAEGKPNNNMSQLAVLSQQDITARVQSSNSFTKGEMLAHRSAITDARRQKREKLSTMTGSQLGTLVEEQMKAKGATIRDIKTRSSTKQQTWTITMVAPVHKSEAAKLADEAKRLAKRLNEVEAKYEEAKSKEASTEVVTTPAK